MTATLALDDETLPSPATRWRPSAAALVAFGGFIFLAILVLTKATALLEPDDYAYRASIVALSHGHILLTNTQYEALNRPARDEWRPGNSSVAPPRLWQMDQ